MKQGLQIGEVAKETGLGIHAIRFYEREGLLREPARTEGGYRLFAEDSVSDLKFIRRAQNLGFSLSEIRELLILRRTTSQGCAHVRELLKQKLIAVRNKIAELERMKYELQVALRKCDQDLKRAGNKTERACPVLAELGRSNAASIQRTPASGLSKRSTDAALERKDGR
ncbi:MAG: heavy metal-responsive transcriptional regulator [Terriglobia bacterium]